MHQQNIIKDCPDEPSNTSARIYKTNTATVETWKGCSDMGTTGTVTITLSSEYTTADLKSNIAALPAYDDDWNDTAGSFANLSTDELSYSIRESRYRLRFKIPKVKTGKHLRVSWVERFIAEAGVAVTSVEIYARGVYRPMLMLTATDVQQSTLHHQSECIPSQPPVHLKSP
jgi:hypothetical protein